eukprot:5447721-Amphidinium_carterae.1
MRLETQKISTRAGIWCHLVLFQSKVNQWIERLRIQSRVFYQYCFCERALNECSFLTTTRNGAR